MASATVLDSGGVHCWGGAPCPLCPLTGRHRLRCLPPSKRNRSATSWRPPPAPPPTYTHLWLVPLSHSARCWHQHPTPPAGTQAPSPSTSLCLPPPERSLCEPTPRGQRPCEFGRLADTLPRSPAPAALPPALPQAPPLHRVSALRPQLAAEGAPPIRGASTHGAPIRGDGVATGGS